MSGWQAVSFITLGTPYEREVQRLRQSAASLGIPLVVYGYKPKGSWRANLNYKSACILRAMDEYPGKDIVFVDADAKFHEWPVLFDGLSASHDYDIAFHRFVQSRLDPGRELLSGTLWIANTERGRRLVTEWHEKALALPAIRHQRALDEVVRVKEAGWRCFILPLEYTAIFDHPAVRGRIEPVIEHFQASRRFRRTVRAAA